MISTANGHSSAAEIKAAAAGRELEILERVAGIPSSLLNKKGHPCPRCKDGDDRFSLIDERRGAVICRKCFAQDNGDFISAVMHFRGLSFPDACHEIDDYLGRTKGRQCAPAPHHAKAAPKCKPKAPTKTFPTADAAIESMEAFRGIKHEGKWLYRNADGSEAAWVVRFKEDGLDRNGKPKKAFPNAYAIDGGWVINQLPAPRPLYRLPDIINCPHVYVCEGEKAADAAAAIGLPATTFLGGSSSPDKTDWQPLAGKRVTYLSDNDKPGEECAARVEAILQDLSPPAIPAIVRLPELPPAGDVADFIDAQGDAAEPEAIAEMIEKIAAETTRKPKAKKSKPQSVPIITRLSDVVPVETAWLWKDRIPLGGATVIMGYGGEGKSFLSCAIATCVSHGYPFPDGSPCPKGSVVILAGEDSESRLKERYEVNGADTTKIVLLQGARIPSDKTGEDDEPDDIAISLRDIETIQAAVETLDDCKLIIVDPVGDFIPGIDNNKDNEVRSLLNPICRLAGKKEIAVLLICHRKKSGGERADNAALGSVAFVNKARAVHVVMYDPTDEAPPSARRRLFLPGKINDAPKPEGLAFVIQAPSGLIAWEDTRPTMTSDEAMQLAAAKARGDQRDRGPEAESLQDAEAWLRAALSSGPRESKDLIQEARNGQDIKQRTLERAKRSLRAKAYQEKFGGPWFWKLPEPTPEGGREWSH